MTSQYVELHCHSNYSFKEGASSLEELLIRARELGYPALAVTDHDNLCGAMEFSRIANSIAIQPITGAEITCEDGSHLTFLVETRRGYANLCNLITYSRIGRSGRRLDPRLDPILLREHSEGLILLTGCSKGEIPLLLSQGRSVDAESELRSYLDWFGPDNVFIEIQQNLVYGDTLRNRQLNNLARRLNVPVVATNNVHYHLPRRHRLHDALVSIQHNKTLDETHRERHPNTNFYLKSDRQMATLFKEFPRAILNTNLISERCAFNLEVDLGYSLPNCVVPAIHTEQSYLEEICVQAAMRKYGCVSVKVKKRLRKEFQLIKERNLAGFFLIYYEVIQLARQVMVDLGLGGPSALVEERSPGVGRGSSVSMLIGYLIGLSHIDPMKYELGLDRFLNGDARLVPDIDLDFPRNIRNELIKRVHLKYGWGRAALTGAIATYKMKGCIRDLGKVLGLPIEDLNSLAKRVDTYRNRSLKSEMGILPEFRDKTDAPVWSKLIELASELQGFPKYLMQHSSGMIISSSSLTEMVPLQHGGTDGRYICQWDKDSVSDAKFVKIDFLSLATLSQMQEALQLIEECTGASIDLSKIDFEDQDVYRSLHTADTIGVFQIESAAQMQSIIRMKPTTLREMAYQVAIIRPGVGINHGANQFIDRYRGAAEVVYDHRLEEDALGRTKGVILYQDQVNELAVSVAGFSYQEGDKLRRAFGRKNNTILLREFWGQFRDGAANKGLSEKTARKIFGKLSGQYMFPESHAYAFGVTAYQMAWLKYHYPLQFYVSIFNQQPMGFYNLETLKEDARRHGIHVLNPDINESLEECTIKDDESFILGLSSVNGLSGVNVNSVLVAREKGRFQSLADAMIRIGLRRKVVENLVLSGAFDSMISDRRLALWEVGLLYRPINSQGVLPFTIHQSAVDLPRMSDFEIMLGEYQTMSVHPSSHLMAYMRLSMDEEVMNSQDVSGLEHGTYVTVAGLVIRRQRPRSETVFITLEDEFGHIQLIVRPQIFERYRLVIGGSVLKVRGLVSRKDRAVTIITHFIEDVSLYDVLPPAKNWG